MKASTDFRTQSFVLFSCIVLSVWNVPDILKFCAFYFGGFSGMASPILVGHSDEILNTKAATNESFLSTHGLTSP